MVATLVGAVYNESGEENRNRGGNWIQRFNNGEIVLYQFQAHVILHIN